MIKPIQYNYDVMFPLLEDINNAINNLIDIANKLEVAQQLTPETSSLLDKEEDTIGNIIQRTMYNGAVDLIVTECGKEFDFDTPADANVQDANFDNA